MISNTGRHVGQQQAVGDRVDEPRSFTWERLWFLEQLAPGTAAYQIPCAMRLRGRLRPPALEQALAEILQRHEMLRTTFQNTQGRPIAVVTTATPLRVPVISLASLPYPDCEHEAMRKAVEICRAPFDLASGPLLRAALIELRDDDHLLVLTFHRLVADLLSVRILLHELGALYTAFAGESSALLPAPSSSYTQAVGRQHEWLQTAAAEGALAYWRRQLESAPPALELPYDRPRPVVQSDRGRTIFIELSDVLSASLRSLCMREGAPLIVVALAALQVLLYRYTGQEEIVLGTVAPGRLGLDADGLVGPFENLLAIRSDLSGAPSFREMVQRTQRVFSDALAHQMIPFDMLAQVLPVRDPGRPSFFQVLMAYQEGPIQPPLLPDLQAAMVEISLNTARFDISLTLHDGHDRLRIAAEYSTDLFDEATISRLLEHLRNLLAGAVSDPEQHIEQLPLLSAQEKHQLLVSWNSSRLDYERCCVPDLFAQQVAHTPDTVAVEDGDRYLTYRELDRQANRLAHRLQAIGVGPEMRVGISMDRSLEMVVGVLAIFKAGGAYVPLSPTFPKDRLAFMLEDAEVKVLLTQRRILEGLPATGYTAICLDEEWERLAQESDSPPPQRLSPENLTYVIYTSGSTGKPKGVGMIHRSSVNLLMFFRHHPAFSQPLRTLQFTTLSFDVAFQEIFTTWCTGGTLVLISEERQRDFLQMPRWLAERRIERLFLPFVALQQLADAWKADEQPLHLKQVITAGEQLQITQSIGSMFTRLPDAVLHNQYGPTECHVIVTDYALSGSPDAWPLLAPIGRPLPNVRLYVLDRYGEPVPVGVAGELHIGGTSLARGYLNRPELNAERFVRDPFSDDPQDRLYKTGDLARYLPSGEIQFLGRIDHQVKVRGFRIELGEIEFALGKHPAVRETVVVAREAQAGEKRLVAYIVAQAADQTLSIKEMRTFLQQSLPEYMIPSAFVQLERLPLTPTGKVDRRSLPDPGEADMLTTEYTPPRTPREEALVGLMADILHMERVGIHDNFFDLGGHSLMGTQLLSGIKRLFHVDLQLRLLFEQPTAAGLAVAIEDAMLAMLGEDELALLLDELEGST